MKNRTGLMMLLGGLAGAGLAWLFLTDDGKKMMRMLKDKMGELGEDLPADFDGIKLMLSDFLSAAKDKAKDI